MKLKLYIIAIFAIFSFVAYSTYRQYSNHRLQAPFSTPTTSTPLTNPWHQYDNVDLGVSFDYPESAYLYYGDCESDPNYPPNSLPPTANDPSPTPKNNFQAFITGLGRLPLNVYQSSNNIYIAPQYFYLATNEVTVDNYLFTTKCGRYEQSLNLLASRDNQSIWNHSLIIKTNVRPDNSLFAGCNKSSDLDSHNQAIYQCLESMIIYNSSLSKAAIISQADCSLIDYDSDGTETCNSQRFYDSVILK